jgi:hypothetical protein
MITMDIDVINEAIKYLFGKIYKNKLIECWADEKYDNECIFYFKYANGISPSLMNDSRVFMTKAKKIISKHLGIKRPNIVLELGY